MDHQVGPEAMLLCFPINRPTRNATNTSDTSVTTPMNGRPAIAIRILARIYRRSTTPDAIYLQRHETELEELLFP